MTRKLFVSILAVVLAICALAGCGSPAQAPAAASDASSPAAAEDTPVTLTLNHDGSTTHPYQYGSEKLAELAKEYSNGTINIEIYPSSQIASGTKAVEFVQMGTLDIALCASTSMVNFVPETGVIDMPFLFKDKDEVFKILDGEVGQQLEAAAEAAGFVILGWADNGFKCVSNDVHPITCKADYAGLKIRVPETETFIKMYEALGAVPTAMAVGEVYTAIQTGVVSGQDNTVANFVKNKYYEIQSYLTVSNHIYTAEPYVMSTDKFYSLSANQQDALRRAVKEACEYERELSLQQDADNIKIVEEAGVEITYLSDDAIAEIKEAVQPVYDLNEANYGDTIRKIQEILG